MVCTCCGRCGNLCTIQCMRFFLMSLAVISVGLSVGVWLKPDDTAKFLVQLQNYQNTSFLFDGFDNVTVDKDEIEDMKPMIKIGAIVVDLVGVVAIVTTAINWPYLAFFDGICQLVMFAGTIAATVMIPALFLLLLLQLLVVAFTFDYAHKLYSKKVQKRLEKKMLVPVSSEPPKTVNWIVCESWEAASLPIRSVSIESTDL